MAKNLVFGLILALKFFVCEFYFYKMSGIVITYRCMQFQGKIMKQTWKNGEKLSWGPFSLNSGCHFFLFLKIWFRQSLEIIVSYHHVQYQKKLMIQSWENLVTDGQTDKRTDRQTDKSDFIGHCSTNTKRPVTKLINDTKKSKNWMFLPWIC